MIPKTSYSSRLFNPAAYKNILIWVMAAVFYLYEVALRVSPAGITDQLMHHFGITSTGLGILVGAYYWAYVVMQLPCGLILDKFGSQKVISLSSLICAFGTILFCQSDSMLIALIGRMMVGIGSACAFIGALKIATDWFSPKRFALIAGLTNMMGTIGGNFAGAPLSFVIENYGWVNVFTFMGFLGFFIAFLAYIIIEDKPTKTFEKFSSLKRALSELCTNKQIWLAGLIGGILYLPITAFAELWGVPYLTRVFNHDALIGSMTTNFVFMGMAIGGPIFAVLAGRMKSYKLPLQVTTVLAGIICVLIVCAPYIDQLSILILLFLLGLVIGGQVLVFSLAKVNVDHHAYGTAMGFTNAIISLVGMLSQIIMGVIIDFFWDGRVSEMGTRIYTVDSYQHAIAFLPVFMLCALFMLLYVDNRFETLNTDAKNT